MGRSIYLCAKCSDNPDALRKAELKVRLMDEEDTRMNRLILNGCLLFVILAVAVLSASYVFYGEEGMEKCFAGLFALVGLVVYFLFWKK